ncbi:MAG: hypothetical protein JNN30_06140 [Rhodanobacteraceae bacterium]|nr:hypothetical protein [Rhodanobacteraceae bacterium]
MQRETAWGLRRMLEGFDLVKFSSIPRPGRPAGRPSNRLRNLAWLRFLLRGLDDVRDWAGTSEFAPANGARAGTTERVDVVGKPRPRAWTAHRRSDALSLARVFASLPDLEIASDPLQRRPALLDAVFGPLFSGAEDSTGRYFSDRLVRGVVSPDASRLERLDDLVPGSRRAFVGEPEGVDPWLYDALDFSNPWFAKLYLWRACDPDLQDPQWTRWLVGPDATDGMPRLNDSTRAEMNVSFDFTEDDAARLSKMVLGAMAFTAEPELLHAPSGEVDEVKAELLAAAAAPWGAVPHPVARGVAKMAVLDKWAALSNAVAGVRLCRMVGGDAELAAWWLHGVREGMRGDVDGAQRVLFCPAQYKPGLRFALDEALDAVAALPMPPNEAEI